MSNSSKQIKVVYMPTLDDHMRTRAQFKELYPEIKIQPFYHGELVGLFIGIIGPDGFGSYLSYEQISDPKEMEIILEMYKKPSTANEGPIGPYTTKTVKVIAGKTLDEWKEFARRDDCLDQMVPSDLRQLIANIPERI